MATNRENVYIDLDKRILMLHGDVDKETIGKMCFNLTYLITEDDKSDEKEKDFKRETIHVYINSYGGYLDDMWALVELMLKSKTPIYTYCTGYAMSAGFKIFIAGHKRFISKYAKLMYHQLSGCEFC